MLTKQLYTTLIVLSALLGSLLVYHHTGKTDTKEQEITIGIIQTASHPALDQVRESFISEMAHLLKGRVHFIKQNAEGSLSQAQRIAESFHSQKKITAILAIATPAVQAAVRAETKKPLFIAAISDPKSIGIDASIQNVCGTTDRVDTEAQADLILRIFPKIRTVALMYNPGENNSQSMVKEMQESLHKRGIETVNFGVHMESEIAQAVAKASRKGELILIPADNLLVGAMPLVSREALKKGIPLIASDIPSVAKGALIAQGADYSDLGKCTAEIAYEVLSSGQTPQEVGIHHPTSSKVLINKRVMESLKISLPEELLPSVTLIESQGGSHVP